MKSWALKAVAAGAVFASVFAAFGDTFTKTGIVVSDGDVEPGVWNNDYAKARAYANENGLPIIVFWGNTGCSHCENSEKSIGKNEEFAAWAKENEIVLAIDIGGNNKFVHSGAKGFAGPSGSYPFVRWYWKDDQGVVHSKKHQSDITGGTLLKIAKQVFTDNGWVAVPKNSVFEFQGSGEGEDSYQVTEATDKLILNVARSEKCERLKTPTNGVVMVIGPDGKTTGTAKVSWEVGELAKDEPLKLDIPEGMKAGDKMTLKVLDASGKELSSVEVPMVEEPENSPLNPLWIGERKAPADKKALTAAKEEVPELKFGEWTMDIDVAKDLVRNFDGEAYTLVGLFGSLWCPDCVNTDANFINQDKFHDWATNKHHVALVAIDIPYVGGADAALDPEAYTLEPTLLSRKAGWGASGLAYLTRKGVDDDAANEVLWRNIEFVNSNKYFHRAWDKNPNRTGVPIFVLLRKDGSVAARFTRFASVSPTTSKDIDSFLKRFDEMIAIASKDGENDVNKAEDANGGPGEGATELPANGGTAYGELSHADSVDAFRLTGMGGNAVVSLTATGDSEAKLAMTLWKLGEDGAAEWLGTKALVKEKTLKSGNLKLDYVFAEAGDYYVTVSNVKNWNMSEDDYNEAFDTSFAETSAKENNFASFTLTSAVASFIPLDVRAEGRAAEGSSTVPVALAEGQRYRITNLGANDDYLVKDESLDDVYTARVTRDDAPLALADASAPFVFQAWNPGQVGFEGVEKKVSRKTVTTNVVAVTEQKGLVTPVKVVRPTDAKGRGLSGKVSATVALDKETDFYINGDPERPRFYWTDGGAVTNADLTFTWEEGDDTTYTVYVGFVDEYLKTKTYYGDGKVVLAVTVAEEELAGETAVGPFATFRLDMEDKDPVQKSTVGISATDPAAAKGTVYAKTNSSVKVEVERTVNALGAFKLGVKATSGALSESELAWENFEEDSKSFTLDCAGIPVGKTSTVTLSVKEGKSVKLATKSVKVKAFDAEAPEFLTNTVKMSFHRYVKLGDGTDYDVFVNPRFLEADDELSFKVVGGSLPKGVTLVDGGKYNLHLSGVPTSAPAKSGVGQAIVQVTVKRVVEGKKTKTMIPGLTCCIDYTYDEPTKTDGTVDPASGEKSTLNPACTKSRTLKDIPFVGEGLFSDQALDGVLQLTIPATGKLSAKLLSTTGTVSFAAKSWDELDTGDGTLKATLPATTKSFKDWVLKVTAHADGPVEAVVYYSLGGERYPAKAVISDGKPWSAAASAANWQGYYTVAMPVDTDTIADAEREKGYAPRGTGYVTFEVKSSSFKSGSVTWAGMLPNGTSIKGSSTLMRGEGAAYLPIYTSTKTDVFGAVALIEEYAKSNATVFAETEGADGCRQAVYEPKYDATSGTFVYGGHDDVGSGNVYPQWIHVESKGNGAGDYGAACSLYGGIYDYKGIDKELSCCCEKFHGTTNMTFTVMSSAFAEYGSDYYDFTLFPAPLDVKVGASSFKFVKAGDNGLKVSSFTRSTGVLKGTFKLPYGPSTKTLTANWQGLVVVGWGACGACGDGGKPFVNGAWFVKDKLGYKTGTSQKWLTVLRGGNININAKSK